VFDSLLKVIRHQCREDMLKGTILVSPDDLDAYLAFYVKSLITDIRPSKTDDSVADERLLLVQQKNEDHFETTPPAKFIDLHPPAAFAKPFDTAASMMAVGNKDLECIAGEVQKKMKLAVERMKTGQGLIS